MSPRNMALTALLAAASMGYAGAAWAQGKVDFGKREFESKCASCHGKDAKGEGILKPYLARSAPDLTQAAKRNGGVFPLARLYETIEGSTVPAHGSRDMPVWGRDYRVEAAEYYRDVPYNEDPFVRVRILALLEYLNRIQAR